MEGHEADTAGGHAAAAAAATTTTTATAAAADAAGRRLRPFVRLLCPLLRLPSLCPRPCHCGPDDGRFLELSEDYKQQLEKEIHLQCSELIHLLESVLLKAVHRAESKCVYLKLAGDMYRYLAELVLARTGFTSAGCAGGYDKKSHECYSMAYKLAASALPPNHPVRLQCALNLSVCLYEILRERKAACDIAKAAFDGAIAKLEELEESQATRTPRSSCSCSETTSHCGHSRTTARSSSSSRQQHAAASSDDAWLTEIVCMTRFNCTASRNIVLVVH